MSTNQTEPPARDDRSTGNAKSGLNHAAFIVGCLCHQDFLHLDLDDPSWRSG